MKKKSKRLPELQVKRITPDELPDSMIFKLNVKYKAQLSDFVMVTDNKQGIVYVRKDVLTDEEIENIIKVIEWPTNAVFDEENEAGKFCDYAYERYGFALLWAMQDAHSYRRKFRMTQKAEKHAKKLVPFLLDYDDMLPTLCYEELIDEIGSHSKSLLVDLGYLIAKGVISVNEKTLRIKKKGSEENETC